MSWEFMKHVILIQYLVYLFGAHCVTGFGECPILGICFTSLSSIPIFSWCSMKTFIYQPLSETKCRCTYITYSIVEYVYTVYIYIYTYVDDCVCIGLYLYICAEYLYIILWPILHILCFQPHILHAWASSWLCFSICPYSRKFSFQTSFDNVGPPNDGVQLVNITPISLWQLWYNYNQ